MFLLRPSTCTYDLHNNTNYNVKKVIDSYFKENQSTYRVGLWTKDAASNVLAIAFLGFCICTMRERRRRLIA